MSAYNVFELLGGIGLFLYGMQMMGDGLQRAAGSKMRKILASLTKNRLIATIVGIVITAIIQSSSAVTAMVVSFVNAGMMELVQSVGVIFGANIGTSVTGQLMAFSFEKIAPLIVALSMIAYMFIKNDMVKKIAFVILGFGILFLGLGMMKESMSVLAQSQSVIDAIQSAKSPVLLLVIGLVFTAIIQSNSAMTGILIGMAASGLITVEMSFYVILGSNIGACVTAVISSLNGNRSSKRAALIHVLFNVIGTVIIFVLLMFLEHPIEQFIALLSPGTNAAEIATREVAMANTVFRVFNVLIMFPFAKGLVKLTQIIVPVKDHSGDVEDYTKLKYIGDHTAAQANTALFETAKEILRVGQLVEKNLDIAHQMILTGDKRLKQTIETNEGYVDSLCSGIQSFMVKVTQMELSREDEEKISGFFHVIIDIERVGDRAVNLAEYAESVLDNKIVFSEDAEQELEEMFKMVEQNFKDSLYIFKEERFDMLPGFAIVEGKIDKAEETAQANHIKRMTQGICSPNSGIFSDIFSNLERIGDHANNIAFAILPEGTRINLKTGALVRKYE